MDNLQLLQLMVLFSGALAVSSIVLTLIWPYASGEKRAEKRFRGAIESSAARGMRRQPTDQGAQRKQAVTDALKSLEEQQKKSNRVGVRTRLGRAGLRISPKTFYLLSVMCGLLFFIFGYLLVPNFSPFVWGIFALIGTFGFPQWVLSILISRRQKKFIA